MTVERIPIGTFSRVTGLSQRALRLSDERGPLVPAGKDLCTGFLSYTADQIDRGVVIGHLASTGFGLVEIGALIDARAVDDLETIRRLFAARRKSVGAESRQLAAIEAARARGLEWNGPPRELYLNDPHTVGEQELMTEVHYPVV